MQPEFRKWQEHWSTASRVERHLNITDKGLVLGTTVLAKFDEKGTLAPDKVKLLVLLSSLQGSCDASRVLRYVEAAGKAYKRGDKTLAAMHLALTGIVRLETVSRCSVFLSPISC